ncbi:MAG: D-erythro-7,8-dihydroneopterin triphosphate epimerase [Lysobacterales bacterium]|jgi:D-erythro-7,8-dihydroneopterin triphosphate epimerase
MATIRITNLGLRCIIGANDWERDTKQDIIINCEINFDVSKSSVSDNLDDTIDYKTVTKEIITAVESSEFFLIEKLGSMILDIMCANKLVETAHVIIDKPNALRFADSVSVELSRSN